MFERRIVITRKEKRRRRARRFVLHLWCFTKWITPSGERCTSVSTLSYLSRMEQQPPLILNKQRESDISCLILSTGGSRFTTGHRGPKGAVVVVFVTSTRAIVFILQFIGVAPLDKDSPARLRSFQREHAPEINRARPERNETKDDWLLRTDPIPLVSSFMIDHFRTFLACSSNWRWIIYFHGWSFVNFRYVEIFDLFEGRRTGSSFYFEIEAHWILTNSNFLQGCLAVSKISRGSQLRF